MLGNQITEIIIAFYKKYIYKAIPLSEICSIERTNNGDR